jgi:hypothetical protein
MIPLFDTDGDLPQGMHQTTWTAFRERFCIFARSDRRLRLCRQIGQMLEEAQASCGTPALRREFCYEHKRAQ